MPLAKINPSAQLWYIEARNRMEQQYVWNIAEVVKKNPIPEKDGLPTEALAKVGAEEGTRTPTGFLPQPP